MLYRMFSFIFDFATIVVGAVLPMFRTWKVLKSRKSRQLIPLSKYWIVFAAWVTIESLANLFSLPYFIPAYSFLKFIAVLYTSLIGYEHIYQKFVSPFLQEYEPNGKVLVASAQYYASRATQHALTYAWNTITSCSPRSNAIMGQANGQNRSELRSSVRIVELEEQDDFFELVEQEELDDLDAESDNESDETVNGPAPH